MIAITRQIIDMPQPMYDTTDKAVRSSSEISFNDKQHKICSHY